MQAIQFIVYLGENLNRSSRRSASQSAGYHAAYRDAETRKTLTLCGKRYDGERCGAWRWIVGEGEPEVTCKACRKAMEAAT